MTKSELIKRLKARYDAHGHEGLYLKDISQALDIVLDEISETLARGDRVELRGFGSFSIRKRAPRKARNPKTGESVFLGERKAIYYRAGKELRERLNG